MLPEALVTINLRKKEEKMHKICQNKMKNINCAYLLNKRNFGI